MEDMYMYRSDSSKLTHVHFVETVFVVSVFRDEEEFFHQPDICDGTQKTDVLALVTRFCVQLRLATWSHGAFVSKHRKKTRQSTDV